eukprot:11552_1
MERRHINTARSLCRSHWLSQTLYQPFLLLQQHLGSLSKYSHITPFNMNLVFVMLSTLLKVTTSYDGIWNVGTSIPRGLCAGAIGYHNNSIYLLGGASTSSHRSLLVYDLMINNFTDYGEFYLPLSDKISYQQGETSFHTQ